MPRKPKLPPPIIRLESLSTGRELRPEFIVDDLGEGTVRVVQDARAARELKSRAEMREAEHKQRLRYHKAVLVIAGMGEHVGYVPPPQVVVPEGKMFIGKITRKDGSVMGIFKDKPPFRRL